MRKLLLLTTCWMEVRVTRDEPDRSVSLLAQGKKAGNVHEILHVPHLPNHPSSFLTRHLSSIVNVDLASFHCFYSESDLLPCCRNCKAGLLW